MGIEKIRRRISAPAYIKRASFSGVTNIVSGSSTVVVSASQIASGAAIMLSLGLTTVASHLDLVLSCNSLVTKTSMVVQSNLATVDSQQICYTIHGG